MASANRWWAKLDARYRIAISALLALLAWFLLDHHVRPASRVLATWDVFAVAVLALAWLAILSTSREELRRHAREQDLSHLLMFVFAVLAACASLFAVVFLFANARTGQPNHLKSHIALSVIAVLSAWALIHTVFGLRYAHVFYGDSPDDAKRHAGGLDFPANARPITWTSPISPSSSA